MSDSGSSFGKWIGGILGTIITGLVIWWLTGPLSPFVHKGSSDTNNNNGGTSIQTPVKNNPGNTQTDPAPERQIVVGATPEPYTIKPGELAAINVLAYTNDKIPLENAHVEVDAGGGFFSVSGNHTELGTTNSNGIFKTYWKSPDPSSMAYGMSVIVSKDGFITGKAELTVQINH